MRKRRRIKWHFSQDLKTQNQTEYGLSAFKESTAHATTTSEGKFLLAYMAQIANNRTAAMNLYENLLDEFPDNKVIINNMRLLDK